MNIVLFNWRDLENPKAGGAEVATDKLLRGLADRGHSATWFTSMHPGAAPSGARHGYRVIRKGSELTCRFHALAWLVRNVSAFDVAIDEVNTLPFLSKIVMSNRTMVWMHQLAREVWLAEAPPLLGAIGYAAEPALMAIYRRNPIMTISTSSARSFLGFGLRGPVHVAEISLAPPSVGAAHTVPGRIGYVGRLAPSKRIEHIIRALRFVKESVPGAHLVIVGTGAESEIARLRALARKEGVPDRVIFTGRVLQEQRNVEMASFDVLAMTSFREGWGLVVSEAARYGVPSVVYPSPGLVDAVKHGVTGIVTSAPEPRLLAESIVAVMSDSGLRRRLGEGAKDYLLQFTDERFVGRFERELAQLVLAARGKLTKTP